MSVGLHIEDEVLEAQAGNSVCRERLLGKHRPFVASVASSTIKRRLDWANDDELSLALIAFNEAIDSFDFSRHRSFLSFARTVIVRRLIDHFRRESRSLATPLSAYSEEQLHLVEAGEAEAAHARETARSSLADEVAEFTRILKDYGISFGDLVKASPKHRDTRETLARVARLVVGSPPLMQHLRRHRQLPLREIELLSGVSRRQLENGRRYIVALALMLSTPGLDGLKDFAPLPAGESIGGKP